MDKALGKEIIDLRQRIVANFRLEHWQEIGLLTEHSETIDNYPRLIRSFSWNDEDYGGNVLGFLRHMAQIDRVAFDTIVDYINEKFPGESEFVSAKPAEKRITFAPNVFTVPPISVDPDLVAVMMPFSAEFTPVYKAISRASEHAGLHSKRADDIWEDSIVVQDIFNLVFRAQAIVVDFTGRNPNVMYETGIAHTLGKHVVPISQSVSDVPFDLQHHRVLKYLANTQGLEDLERALTKRLLQVTL